MQCGAEVPFSAPGRTVRRLHRHGRGACAHAIEWLREQAMSAAAGVLHLRHRALRARQTTCPQAFEFLTTESWAYAFSVTTYRVPIQRGLPPSRRRRRRDVLP